MLMFLFGPAGAGKNFVGELLGEGFGYHFYDADDDLTPEVITAVKKREPISSSLRRDYFNKVIERVKELGEIHRNIVCAQALIRDENRLQILGQLPDAVFIHIKVEPEIIDERLRQRNDWVDVAYGREIQAAFEPPSHDYFILENNGGKDNVTQQLKQIINEIKMKEVEPAV